jgi:hypothetical protein
LWRLTLELIGILKHNRSREFKLVSLSCNVIVTIRRCVSSQMVHRV